jgi:hypothetical protein
MIGKTLMNDFLMYPLCSMKFPSNKPGQATLASKQLKKQNVSIVQIM